MFSLVPLSDHASLRERVAAALLTVVARVTRRVWQAPAELQGVLIPALIAELIKGWLARRNRLIQALLVRIETGTQRAPVPYRARAVAADGTVREGRTPPQRMPRQFAWLCVLAQEVRGDGRWLGALLNEPEMRDKVLAHPQLARLVRPVLRALGERAPAWMPKPVPVRRAPRRRPDGAARGTIAADAACAALARLVDETMERGRRWARAESRPPGAHRAGPVTSGDTAGTSTRADRMQAPASWQPVHVPVSRSRF